MDESRHCLQSLVADGLAISRGHIRLYVSVPHDRPDGREITRFFADSLKRPAQVIERPVLNSGRLRNSLELTGDAIALAFGVGRSTAPDEDTRVGSALSST